MAEFTVGLATLIWVNVTLKQHDLPLLSALYVQQLRAAWRADYTHMLRYSQKNAKKAQILGDVASKKRNLTLELNEVQQCIMHG